MKKNYIGLYGLGVMGQSLVQNMARHGIPVSAYNKFDYDQVTVPFLEGKAAGLPVSGYEKLEDFVQSLERPRKILLMTTAGKATDSVIEELVPLLEEGDMIADCGNSFFEDTRRREQKLKKQGILYFGVGVSGGEKGALEGPSIMPGGNEQNYSTYLAPVLEAIAAKAGDGSACCTYIGEDGAGHYVKMVHNGIEYGDIQIICEAYSLMKNVLGLSNQEMADVFAAWNIGRLQSYLIEITSKILRKKDEETGTDLIDMILDEAGQKGTGKWTSIQSVELGVCASTMVESVEARFLSARKEERVKASQSVQKERVDFPVEPAEFLSDLEQAVFASKVVSYAQGFALLIAAAEAYDWKLDMGKIALIWREGCIIRAGFLERIAQAYQENPQLENLMFTPEFQPALEAAQSGWRRVGMAALAAGIYAPCIVSALQYFDGYTSRNLPANLLQAQRDWFGAHTYHRIDRDHDQSFHTIWEDGE